MNSNTCKMKEAISLIEKRIDFELSRHGGNRETIERIFDTYFEDLNVPQIIKLQEMVKGLLFISLDYCENQDEYNKKIILLKKHLNQRRWRLNQVTYQSDINIVEIMKNTCIPAQQNIKSLTMYMMNNLNGIHKDFVMGMQFMIGEVR